MTNVDHLRHAESTAITLERTPALGLAAADSNGRALMSMHDALSHLEHAMEERNGAAK